MSAQRFGLIVDHGAIAQLVEHLHGMQGVRSSSLLGSIFEIPCTAMDLFFFDRSNLARETGRDAPHGGRAALFPIHKLVTLFFLVNHVCLI